MNDINVFHKTQSESTYPPTYGCLKISEFLIAHNRQTNCFLDFVNSLQTSANNNSKKS